MSKNDKSVSYLYGTASGRAVLKILMKAHLDKLAVGYLRSALSRPVIKSFARKNGIVLTEDQLRGFRTYRDFFLRDKTGGIHIDMEPTHLISPCDSWLSVFKVQEDSTFEIKGSHYRLEDLFGSDLEPSGRGAAGAAALHPGSADSDPATDGSPAAGSFADLAGRFSGGDCLIFRLCASDYHHYCYIDDALIGRNHYIEGKLHSVQPIACETFKVYTLNRRSWCLMETRNFGSVVQTEVGALVVGGIVNHHENCLVNRGDEKGFFDLAGSTIAMFFEKDKITLDPGIREALSGAPEVRVSIGMKIGTKYER